MAARHANPLALRHARLAPADLVRRPRLRRVRGRLEGLCRARVSRHRGARGRGPHGQVAPSEDDRAHGSHDGHAASAGRRGRPRARADGRPHRAPRGRATPLPRAVQRLRRGDGRGAPGLADGQVRRLRGLGHRRPDGSCRCSRPRASPSRGSTRCPRSLRSSRRSGSRLRRPRALRRTPRPARRSRPRAQARHVTTHRPARGRPTEARLPPRIRARADPHPRNTSVARRSHSCPA
jgi:hypothetical protein